MIGDGIHDGDIVIINKRATVNNNEMVAVLINNEATLKRFYKRKDGMEPACFVEKVKILIQEEGIFTIFINGWFILKITPICIDKGKPGGFLGALVHQGKKVFKKLQVLFFGSVDMLFFP